MTKLILIRHGQSIGNLHRRFLGHTDLDLSEDGYKQAELVNEYFKNIHIDCIYSSDLKRAYNTVLPISKEKNIPITTSENLREIYAGDWEDNTIEYLDSNYSEDYSVWKNNIGFAKCTNGEDTQNLQNRVYNELKKICDLNSGKTICVGTHATPIRVFAAKCANKAREDIKDIPWVVNAAISVFEYEDGEFRNISYNYTEHLGDLVLPVPKNV